jgi:hypothetical protein
MLKGGSDFSYSFRHFPAAFGEKMTQACHGGVCDCGRKVEVRALVGPVQGE